MGLYSLLRPMLFRFDPGSAHAWSLRLMRLALRASLSEGARRVSRARLFSELAPELETIYRSL